MTVTLRTLSYYADYIDVDGQRRSTEGLVLIEPEVPLRISRSAKVSEHREERLYKRTDGTYRILVWPTIRDQIKPTGEVELFARMPTPELLTKRRYSPALVETILADSGNRPEPEEPTEPKDYLFGWSEIATCLHRDQGDAFQKQIRALHEKHPGPIIFGGRGKPPKVVRTNLIAWWNSLEDLWKELGQRQIDRKATVAGSYQHGREEIVIPDIGGHEKRRRTPKD